MEIKPYMHLHVTAGGRWSCFTPYTFTWGGGGAKWLLHVSERMLEEEGVKKKGGAFLPFMQRMLNNLIPPPPSLP